MKVASNSFTKFISALVGGRKGPWAFISANRPQYTPEQRQQKHEELRKTLRQMNLQPQEAAGGYLGNPEPSFFIYGIDKETAILIGNQFEQDSVAVGQGGNYQFVETTTDKQGNPWPRESPKMDARKDLHVLTEEENRQVDVDINDPSNAQWKIPGYTRLDRRDVPRYPGGDKKRVTLDPQFAPENRPKLSQWIRRNCKFASNGATYNGTPFWSGAVDMASGQIMEVHTYEEAQESDFHHTFYFSRRALEMMRSHQWEFFWIDNGQVNGMWREDIGPQVIGKIESQIQGVTPVQPKPPAPPPQTTDEVFRETAKRPHPGD